jgi:hypothetical protein
MAQAERVRFSFVCVLLTSLSLPAGTTSTPANAKPPLLRASARLSFTRVSELEARIYSRQLVKYSNLGLDGESDMQAISVATGGLLVFGAVGGAIAAQDMPGPDILRWCTSTAFIFSPYAFLSLGLTAPSIVQRGVAAVRSALSPEYRARMLRHEAGHFLVGHIVGLPVVGYATNAASSAVECAEPSADDGAPPIDADEALNRFAVVSLAGVVAECLCFGKAEGGLADLSQLNAAQVRTRYQAKAEGSEREDSEQNRVRWAAVQAYALLHSNGPAFERLVSAMQAGLPVAECEAAARHHA